MWPGQWQVLTQHFIEEYSVGPPVHAGPVRLIVNDLWRDVVWSTAEGLGHGPIADVLLAHSEVRNLDVAVLVQHDVVQLEVSVDHAEGVEENNTDGNLGGVKARERGVRQRLTSYLSTYTATGSLNFPHCWIWYIKSPPLTNSITK